MIPSNPWLLCAALPLEAELLVSHLAEVPPVGRRRAHAGRLGSKEVLVVVTGLGQINAAQAATAALERFPGIQAVINLGTAGAFADSGLEMGRAAVATEVVLADLGVLTSTRLHGLETIGCPVITSPGGVKYHNRLPADQYLNAEILRAAPGLARGAFASVNLISGDAAVADEREARWGVILEEMEAGALALCAALYEKPFAAVRGVSNLAGDRELDLKAGARAAQEAVLAWAGLTGAD